jgi:outer membrane protein assembly factor BamA
MRGIWSEINFNMAPSFLGDGNYDFIKIALIHRQYITLIKRKLSFAYRLAYQGTIAGTVPFYIQPIMINSWAKTTTIDGLGGSQNIRGILRNRVVGDGIVYGTAEFRYKVFPFTLFHQDLAFGLNAFADAGMVVQEINIDKSGIPAEINQNDFFSKATEYPHLAVGGGLKLSYNENFVLSADVGFATDKRDGNMGVYIGFGFIF